MLYVPIELQVAISYICKPSSAQCHSNHKAQLQVCIKFEATKSHNIHSNQIEKTTNCTVAIPTDTNVDLWPMWKQ